MLAGFLFMSNGNHSVIIRDFPASHTALKLELNLTINNCRALLWKIYIFITDIQKKPDHAQRPCVPLLSYVAIRLLDILPW